MVGFCRTLLIVLLVLGVTILAILLIFIAFCNGVLTCQAVGSLMRWERAEPIEDVYLICCPVVTGAILLAGFAYFAIPQRRAVVCRHLFAATIALLVIAAQNGLDSLQPAPLEPTDAPREYYEGRNEMARFCMFLSIGAAAVTFSAAKIIEGRK